ncbi:hypothetical protein K8089_12070 [Aequorivita sp. F47161]|uniref:Uncharacterized protein n=1 Tax=Aequorivita vitellina TaxID=2874475 RepID=A0A9X1QXM5_9FLAO|nr:hypothetical protein [Aequorivita vitellina]MCG2419761.1 hypothetical protein [Aequorivita vitellina]
MSRIKLETESYLIKGNENERFFPFLELELNEWIIYENDTPKYYFDLNSEVESEFEILNWLVAELNSGKKLQDLISELGKRKGKIWNIFPSQLGMEVETSFKTERIELEYLTDRTIEK